MSTTNDIMETKVTALGSAPALSVVAWVLIGLTVGVAVVMLTAAARRHAPEDQPLRTYATTGFAGVVGGLIGGWISTLFGVTALGEGMFLTLLAAIIGAFVLAGGTFAVVKMFARGGRVQ